MITRFVGRPRLITAPRRTPTRRKPRARTPSTPRRSTPASRAAHCAAAARGMRSRARAAWPRCRDPGRGAHRIAMPKAVGKRCRGDRRRPGGSNPRSARRPRGSAPRQGRRRADRVWTSRRRRGPGKDRVAVESTATFRLAPSRPSQRCSAPHSGRRWLCGVAMTQLLVGFVSAARQRPRCRRRRPRPGVVERGAVQRASARGSGRRRRCAPAPGPVSASHRSAAR